MHVCSLGQTYLIYHHRWLDRSKLKRIVPPNVVSPAGNVNCCFVETKVEWSTIVDLRYAPFWKSDEELYYDLRSICWSSRCNHVKYNVRLNLNYSLMSCCAHLLGRIIDGFIWCFNAKPHRDLIVRMDIGTIYDPEIPIEYKPEHMSHRS